MKKNGTFKPKQTSTTGVKYLNIDYRSRFGSYYNVRVNLSGKHFVVWTGNDFSVGEKVAKRVQQLMSQSKSAFLDWYDYDREEWLKENGYQNANSKRPRYCM